MKINNSPGIFAATVGISAVVTAEFGWPEVLIGWCIAAGLRTVLPDKNKRKYNIICMWLLMGLGTVLIGGTILAAEKAFPEDGTFPFVSVGLLLLLYRSLVGEKDTGNMVSNVLGLILLGLLGAIEIFGFAGAEWKEMMPKRFWWKEVWITVSVTSPWWIEGDKENKWGWFGAAGGISVGMSLLCRGLLGSAMTEYSDLPLYQAVQTIHILGTLQRFEALLAATVLLGTFAMLSRIGNIMREMAENIMSNLPNRKWSTIILVVAFIVEHLYYMLESEWKGIMSAVFWGLVAFFALAVAFCRNISKNEKSS